MWKIKFSSIFYERNVRYTHIFSCFGVYVSVIYVCFLSVHSSIGADTQTISIVVSHSNSLAHIISPKIILNAINFLLRDDFYLLSFLCFVNYILSKFPKYRFSFAIFLLFLFSLCDTDKDEFFLKIFIFVSLWKIDIELSPLNWFLWH